MLNQVVLVGRLSNDAEISETENGEKVANVNLAVQRTYKNSEGVYETDFIKCTLWNSVAANTKEYCKKGDLIGVKGHLQTKQYVDKDGNNKFAVNVVAEKITFLSSKPQPKKTQER